MVVFFSQPGQPFDAYALHQKHYYSESKIPAVLGSCLRAGLERPYDTEPKRATVASFAAVQCYGPSSGRYVIYDHRRRVP